MYSENTLKPHPKVQDHHFKNPELFWKFYPFVSRVEVCNQLNHQRDTLHRQTLDFTALQLYKSGKSASPKLTDTGNNSLPSFVRQCNIYFIAASYWSYKSSSVKRGEISVRSKRRILPSYKF